MAIKGPTSKNKKTTIEEICNLTSLITPVPNHPQYKKIITRYAKLFADMTLSESLLQATIDKYKEIEKEHLLKNEYESTKDLPFPSKLFIISALYSRICILHFCIDQVVPKHPTLIKYRYLLLDLFLKDISSIFFHIFKLFLLHRAQMQGNLQFYNMINGLKFLIDDCFTADIQNFLERLITNKVPEFSARELNHAKCNLLKSYTHFFDIEVHYSVICHMVGNLEEGRKSYGKAQSYLEFINSKLDIITIFLETDKKILRESLTNATKIKTDTLQKYYSIPLDPFIELVFNTLNASTQMRDCLHLFFIQLFSNPIKMTTSGKNDEKLTLLKSALESCNAQFKIVPEDKSKPATALFQLQRSSLLQATLEEIKKIADFTAHQLSLALPQIIHSLTLLVSFFNFVSTHLACRLTAEVLEKAKEECANAISSLWPLVQEEILAEFEQEKEQKNKAALEQEEKRKNKLVKKKQAKEKAKREAEEKAMREAEEKAKREAEEKAMREAEEKAKREAEEKAKKMADFENLCQRLKTLSLIKNESHQPLKLLNIPLQVQQLLRALNQDGHWAYIIGGAVRDELLDKKAKDFDVITNCPKDKIESILKLALLENVFIPGLFTIANNQPNALKLEIYCTSRSLQQEVENRDVTLNSFLADSEGLIYDLLGVKHHLWDKYLYPLGNIEQRLVDDPKKVFRFISMSSRFNKWIPQSCLDVMRKHAPLITQKLSFGAYIRKLDSLFLKENGLVNLRKILKLNILSAFLPNGLLLTPITLDYYANYLDYKMQQVQTKMLETFSAYDLIALLLLPKLIELFKQHHVFHDAKIAVIQLFISEYKGNFLEKEKNQLKDFLEKSLFTYYEEFMRMQTKNAASKMQQTLSAPGSFPICFQYPNYAQERQSLAHQQNSRKQLKF